MAACCVLPRGTPAERPGPPAQQSQGQPAPLGAEKARGRNSMLFPPPTEVKWAAILDTSYFAMCPHPFLLWDISARRMVWFSLPAQPASQKIVVLP